MTVAARLAELAPRFGAIVLDQWGVLHDGSAPYPGAVETLERLRAQGSRLAVLSNSGKRAAPNLERIAGMGFAPDLFETVMTSGEALWRDIRDARLSARRFLPVERTPGDADAWAEGLDIAQTDSIEEAEAVLLMGLPDGCRAGDYADLLERARARDLPLYCSNPDLASPRAGGRTVLSPGALARDYAQMGGSTRLYGKPHPPIFRGLERSLDLSPGELLMVGDSLAHDIRGGRDAGWRTLFVTGGLHHAYFREGGALDALARAEDAPRPDYVTHTLEAADA